MINYINFKGFPGSSAGKESSSLQCGRPGFGKSLGWEDPLEKGKATHSSILAWRIHGLCSPWGGKELNIT